MHTNVSCSVLTRESGRNGRRSTVQRAITLCALAVLVLAATGCGELEPIVEPEIVDLQLTLDTLKTQVRDAQRNLAEVRAELESRRQELADAQVARAQLEGRVREAERRVTEARQVIEVQREELMVARAERERVFRSSSQLQSRMKQLQKRGTKSGDSGGMDAGDLAVPMGTAYQWSFGAPSRSATPAINSLPPYRNATAAALRHSPPVKQIIVKSGDTLWSIARKYRIHLNRLRSLNHLTDDLIDVGQSLWVSED